VKGQLVKVLAGFPRWGVESHVTPGKPHGGWGGKKKKCLGNADQRMRLWRGEGGSLQMEKEGPRENGLKKKWV